MKPTEPKRPRDGSLDWIKGMLVVLMVVYHSLNYSPYHPFAFHYLAFLPPAFIFLAGFLLTNSYLGRYDVSDWRLHQRLVMRGAKLILLFTALNLALYLIAFGPFAVWRFAENFRSIYVVPGKRAASFPVLTSIGYLLLVAPLLLRIGSWGRWMLPTLAFALLLFCSVMERTSSLSYHLGMISYGIMGTACGLLPLERIAGFSRKWFIVVPLYCLYRTGSDFIGEPYAMQFAGVVTALLMLYSLAMQLPAKTHVYRQTVLLGRYSLFGYIAELGIIRVILGVFGRFETPAEVLILMVSTLAATWAVTFIIDRLRSTARFVDLTYRAAFA